MLVGYARVSTQDQNLDLQRDALSKVGCERIFEEKKSSKAGTRRPEFETALACLRPTEMNFGRAIVSNSLCWCGVL